MQAKKQNKTNANAKLSAPVGALARLIAIGANGTAFALPGAEASIPPGLPLDGSPARIQWRSFAGTGISPAEICAAHAAGELCGFPEWDLACFAGSRRDGFAIMPLGDALKTGRVTETRLVLRQAGSQREVTVFAPAGWDSAQRVPAMLASLDVPAGRIESRVIRDGTVPRNAGLVGKLLPLTFAKSTPPAGGGTVKAGPPMVRVLPAKGQSAPPAPVPSPASTVKASPKAKGGAK